MEQRREEKKAREEERVNSLLEQGKKVWAASREVEDLPDKRPYPPVPPSAAGKPQERNRSCHICTQGIAAKRMIRSHGLIIRFSLELMYKLTRHIRKNE